MSLNSIGIVIDAFVSPGIGTGDELLKTVWVKGYLPLSIYFNQENL